MPDPSPKLVKVDGLGVVKFPASMSDDKIIAAIRKHKGKTHDLSRPGAGLSTEESERTRQTKDAQPLSPAIPTLPSWATTSLYDDIAKPAGKALHSLDDLVSGQTTAQGDADRAANPSFQVKALLEEAKSRNPANNVATVP